MHADNPSAKSIMIVAGEASGDQHGAALVKALKGVSRDLSIFGVGGEELGKSGVEILCHSEKLAVMGVTEVFSSLREILKSLRFLKNEMARRRPDLLILIDFADFNLRLAEKARRLKIPVFYYITPKVWVWRKNRVKKLARCVDCAAVILPFEESYLRERGVRAKYVGNPVLDSVKITLSRSQFCRRYGIDEDKSVVGILPGSRKKEVSALLPVFLEAARRMQRKYARDLAFCIPLASTLTLETLEQSGLKDYYDELDLHVLPHDRFELMASCDAVVAASGTVTLELAILDVPMVVAYKLSQASYLIGKIFIDIPYFSLVNIIAGKNVVTELLQEQVHPAAVEIELARLLFDEGVRRSMKKEFSEIRKILGRAGASATAAQLAIDTMNRNGAHE
ncbi:MAG TPA: lipid-A-disaccharide synthase [Desulfopila sp.]|nr:lipid-A-disaccharide synthase [Desulfopila sp.]